MGKFVFVTREIPPCKGCEERRRKCHGRCAKYTAWKDSVEKTKEARREFEEKLKNMSKNSI